MPLKRPHVQLPPNLQEPPSSLAQDPVQQILQSFERILMHFGQQTLLPLETSLENK